VLKGFIGSVSRRERIAAALWVVMSVVVGNTVYDLMVRRAVTEYLFRVALYQAGRGPLTPLREVMDAYVYDAAWVGLLFGSAVALAGFGTILMLRPPRPRPGG
jgi:hypothetical protein